MASAYMESIRICIAFFCVCLACAARFQSGKGAFIQQQGFTQANSGPSDHTITKVPGYDGALPSKHYGGYINVEKKSLYYYFVTSERDPENDPVVLWLNGGPGCSSFDGFTYEQGPFKFQLLHENDSHVVLKDNPFAWNKVANMIFLDSPAGVGLSYSEDPDDYYTSDTQTAKDAEHFLRKWFQRYPEFQRNTFFISGESYAGVYVPNLALAVVEGNLQGREPLINIAGYLVGNGVTDEEVDGDALPLFAAGKSLISNRDFQDLWDACDGHFWNRTFGTPCAQLYRRLHREVSRLNIYNILVDCYHGADQQQARQARIALRLAHQHFEGQWPLLGGSPKQGGLVKNWAHLGLTAPCTDVREAAAWLNNPATRQALHAAPIETTGKWVLCSDIISYRRDSGSMIPKHQALTADHGLRALIYSGDHDMAVPHTGTERWTALLGASQVVAKWQPWFVADSQVGGYVVEYEGGLTYATIKGAGHMVPESNPREALAMFQRFIEGSPLYPGGGGGGGGGDDYNDPDGDDDDDWFLYDNDWSDDIGSVIRAAVSRA